MDNTPGDKLGVWRDMRLADALVDTLAKLLEAHNIKFKMFADDVKVYMSVLNADDAATFQTALNIISDWAQDWQL